jgi:ABC-type phosphate transport system substrate-binding protein
LRTLEAIIDGQGNVRLTEPVDLPVGRRALVIILNEPAIDVAETALLSEQSLAEDWNRTEEDEAWSHLQQLGSS